MACWLSFGFNFSSRLQVTWLQEIKLLGTMLIFTDRRRNQTCNQMDDCPSKRKSQLRGFCIRKLYKAFCICDGYTLPAFLYTILGITLC